MVLLKRTFFHRLILAAFCIPLALGGLHAHASDRSASPSPKAKAEIKKTATQKPSPQRASTQKTAPRAAPQASQHAAKPGQKKAQPASLNRRPAATSAKDRRQKARAERPSRPAYAEPYDPNTAQRGEGYLSDGRFIRMQIIRAEDRDPFGARLPTVAILHGASGLSGTTLYHIYAQEFARRGMNAFIVHYYDGLPGVRNPASPQHYPRRDRIINDLLDHLSERADVDPTRIAFFGVSLGGFHTLQIASQDRRVAAAVSLVGAMPVQVPVGRITAMPPTLILHGDQDRIVPVSRAYAAADILDQIGSSYELVIYEGEGHGFSHTARNDSLKRAGDFFDYHLNGRMTIHDPGRPQQTRLSN